VLKKIGAVTAIAASMMLLGSPAFAAGGHDVDLSDQVGLANLNDSDVLSSLNACFIDVNVIAVPVLSDNDSGVCANSDDEE
jgi:hypothetical protein